MTEQNVPAALHCLPREDGAQGLPAEWARFAGYIDVCSLSASDESRALTIVSVSARRYYANRPDGSEAIALPKPLIFDADGREVGRLPYSYPDDPPFAIELSFSQWSKNHPEQIDILVRDPTASGNRRLTPMRWDAVARRYTGGEEK